MLEQLGRAIARVTAHRTAGAPAAALDELRRAHREVLGAPHQLLSLLSPDSVRLVLRDADRRGAYVRLMGLEAELLAACGEARSASALLARIQVVGEGAVASAASLPAGRRPSWPLEGTVLQ